MKPWYPNMKNCLKNSFLHLALRLIVVMTKNEQATIQSTLSLTTYLGVYLESKDLRRHFYFILEMEISIFFKKYFCTLNIHIYNDSFFEHSHFV